MFNSAYYFSKVKKLYKSLDGRQRKRITKLLDKVICPILIIGAFTAIPQTVKIWLYQNAEGVSAISWGAFSFLAAIWMTYGIVHKEKIIIITSSITFVVNISVLIGTLVYG